MPREVIKKDGYMYISDGIDRLGKVKDKGYYPSRQLDLFGYSKLLDILKYHETIWRSLVRKHPARYTETAKSRALIKQSCAELLTALEQEKTEGSIPRLEELMGEIGALAALSGTTKKEELVKLSEEVNGGIQYKVPSYVEGEHVPITKGQLMTATNTHPHFGYFHGDYGVGREDADGNLISAFTTPLGINKDYGSAYAATVYRAYSQMSEQIPFTEVNPFIIYNFGDGEGIMSTKILELFSSQGINPDLVDFVHVDISVDLLTAQRKALSNFIEQGWNVRSVNADVRDISKVIDRKPRKGVIVAGEELIDNLPNYFIRLDKDTGKIVEDAFILEKGEDSWKTGWNVKVPLDQTTKMLADTWFKAFPYYRSHMEYNRYGDRRYPAMPLNVGFLRLMKDLSDLNFEGYWVGGDISQYFHLVQEEPWSSESHIALLSKDRNNEFKRAYGTFTTDAIDKTADLSAHVDPSLLAFAEVLGMRREFSGRMGHFIELNQGKALTGKKDVIDEVSQLTRSILYPEIPAPGLGLKEIMDIYFRMHELQEYYTGVRFNWVYSKGNVPPLFPELDLKFVW